MSDALGKIIDLKLEASGGRAWDLEDLARKDLEEMMKALPPARVTQDRTAEVIIGDLELLRKQYVKTDILLRRELRKVCTHPDQVVIDQGPFGKKNVMSCIICDEEIQ